LICGRLGGSSYRRIPYLTGFLGFGLKLGATADLDRVDRERHVADRLLRSAAYAGGGTDDTALFS